MWGLMQPNVLLTVTGGATDFTLDAEKKDQLLQGLTDMAKSVGEWFMMGWHHEVHGDGAAAVHQQHPDYLHCLVQCRQSRLSWIERRSQSRESCSRREHAKFVLSTPVLSGTSTTATSSQRGGSTVRGGGQRGGGL